MMTVLLLVGCFLRVSLFLNVMVTFSGWWKQNWISCMESFSLKAGSSNHGWNRQYLHKAQ